MKLRYKISIWVVLALAGSLLCGGSVWLGWQGLYRKIPHSITPYHRFGYRSVHSDLCPRYGCTLYSCLMYMNLIGM